MEHFPFTRGMPAAAGLVSLALGLFAAARALLNARSFLRGQPPPHMPRRPAAFYPVVCAVFAVGAALAGLPYMIPSGVSVSADAVEVRYWFPRPARRLPLADIESVRVDDVPVRLRQSRRSEWTLVARVAGRDLSLGSSFDRAPVEAAAGRIRRERSIIGKP